MATISAGPQTRKRMGWVIFVAGAVLSWGAYGVLLFLGQTQLGNPLKALLCVGAAYFLIGVIVPVIGLSSQGGLNGFNTNGLITATVAGALGAAGAACIIWAFKAGGLPVLRHAARVRRRADRERAARDGHPSAEVGHQSDALRRIPARVDRRRDGAVFQADRLVACLLGFTAGPPAVAARKSRSKAR